MSRLSSPWITHRSEAHGGKLIFVGSQTMMQTLVEWLKSSKSLQEFSRAYPDVTQQVAKGAMELGFTLLINDFVNRGRWSRVSPAMACVPDYDGKPMFTHSQTLVADLSDWLQSGRSLPSFLSAHPEVGEEDAKGIIDFCSGFLAKDYFDFDGWPMYALHFEAEITPAAHAEIINQFALSAFEKPCLLIEKLNPKGELTRSTDGEAIWHIERPHPLRAKVVDQQQLAGNACDLLQLNDVLVCNNSLWRPSELAIKVSVRDGQLFVEPRAA